MSAPGSDLSSRVVRQVEYWLSDANLWTDKLLRSTISASGHVPLALLSTFNALQAVCTDHARIAKAVAIFQTPTSRK